MKRNPSEKLHVMEYSLGNMTEAERTMRKRDILGAPEKVSSYKSRISEYKYKSFNIF